MPPATVYRTLLIEDDPQVAQVNAQLIKAAGAFEVVAVHGRYVGALATIEQLRPDLVLLDIHLPDGNGLQLARELRAAGIATELIMITASSQQVAVEQALHAGVIDYLVKPFRPERLQAALQRFVHRVSSRANAPFNQQRIDSLLTFNENGPLEDRLPKGIDAATLQEVAAQLAAQSPLTTDAVSEYLGLSRVTAWRYLEYLVSCQRASSVLVYGSVGRPTKNYSALTTPQSDYEEN